MKRYIKSNSTDTIDFEILIELNYMLTSIKVTASKELDSMDISELEEKIVNFPDSDFYNQNKDDYMEYIVNTDVYKKFIVLVNKIDELLELRGYEVLGESEFTKTDTESKYRGVVMNVSKNTSSIHLSGKLMHTLRLSGHKETRTSRRTRNIKIDKAANSKKAKDINNDNSLLIGEFEAFVVKCTVDSQEFAKIDNKEFYSYADIIRCVDKILDRLELEYA